MVLNRNSIFCKATFIKEVVFSLTMRKMHVSMQVYTLKSVYY